MKKGIDCIITVGHPTRGIPIDEFCKLVEIAVKRYGDKVMIGPQDKKGRAHLTLDKKHLGYIHINTGSLVWDKGYKREKNV